MKFYKTTRVSGGSWYDPEFVYREGRIYRPARGTVAGSYKTCTKRVLHACRTPEEAASPFWGARWPFRLWSFEGTPVVEDSCKAGFRQIGPMVTEDVNLCFGSNGTRIVALLKLLAAASPQQIFDLGKAWTAARGGTMGYWCGSLDAVNQYQNFEDAARTVRHALLRLGHGGSHEGLPWIITRDAAKRFGWTIPTRAAAIYTARALIGAVLIGQYGLEQHHVDTLLTPVIEVFGTDWMNG